MIEDHQLTRYESLVRETPVEPGEAGVELVAAGEPVTVDYSDDSGGSWIGCSCGKQFQDEEAALDHVANPDEGDS